MIEINVKMFIQLNAGLAKNCKCSNDLKCMQIKDSTSLIKEFDLACAGFKYAKRKPFFFHTRNKRHDNSLQLLSTYLFDT